MDDKMARELAWLDKMAARSAERERRRYEFECRQRDAEREAYYRQLHEESLAEFEAGPPGGCHECYRWVAFPFFGPGYSWSHITIESDDQTCYHECHGNEPQWCGPIAYASGM